MQQIQRSSPALRLPVSACAYDLFVVHVAADEPFVQGYLLAKLGLAPGRVLRLQTLELGELIAEQIERGVRSSRVTIVVLSSTSMDDRWAVFGEELAAYARVARRAHGKLLPLLLDDCTPTMHMQALVPLDFRDPTPDAWEAEVDRLRAYLGRSAAPELELPCPYPGMRPFTEGDADRFFGRELELDRIVRRLRRGEREIYIIGASGSGKSSLLAAGLLARLTRGVEGLQRFHVRTFRPGERPLERLAAALEGELTPSDDVIGALLARNAPATSLLLVVDQLEELFAIASDEARRSFLDALRVLRADPRCVLVFALRADFYGSFMDSSLWTDRRGRISHVELGPLHGDSLRMAIERPARELDVYFEAELVSRLLGDADREPGALPLLQETLFQLWRKRRDRLLALADYHAMSDGTRTGLAFAVKEHADDVLGALSDAQKLIAYRILLRLVNFGEGRADTRRQQPRSALRSDGDAGADFDAVLQCLVDNRLVTVTGDDQRGDVRVDLAHEILIQAWPSFADWIRTWRTHEQRRRELEAAAAAWRARGSGDGGLLDRVELANARAWQDKAARQLGHTADLTAFLAASESARNRSIRQHRRTRLAFSAVPFAIATSVLALVAFRNAHDAMEQRNQRNRLVAESAQAYQDIAWQRMFEVGHPLQALPYLIAAGEATEVSSGTLRPPLRMLFAAATRNLPLSPPLQHQGSVVSASFSPDGSRVVTASDDRTARIWDVATGRPISPPLQHRSSVVSAAFSPDGSQVVTASEDQAVFVWDATTGRPASPPLRQRHAVASAASSLGGLRVVTPSCPLTAPQQGYCALENIAQVRDAAAGEPLMLPLQHQDLVLSIAFSRDGSRVVTTSRDETARVWDAATGKPLSPPLQHRGRISSAAFSLDGTRVVTASEDRTARVWNAATGKPLSPPLLHQHTVWSAAFSPDGARVVTASEDRTARVWDAGTGNAVSPPLEHQGAVKSAAFSPDGTRIVTASEDRTARVWDATTGDAVSLPLEHCGTVESAVFSPDGARVVTTSSDRTARIWDVAPDKSLRPSLPHQDVVWSAAFSPDGRRVVTASWDNTARLWDAVTGNPLSPPLEHQDVVWSAAFSPDGRGVVTASSDRTARLWDAATGHSLSPPLEHQDVVWSAAFSPDGRRVVTASSDRTARVWDAVTGKPLSRPMEHLGAVVSAAFSPDGTRVVTASSDWTARVWDAVTGKPLSQPMEHRGVVLTAAFSLDGTRIATASDDKTARVWDAATGKPVSPPLEHLGSVESVAFSPDGTRVVSASDDNTARVWDAATGTLLSPSLQHQGPVRRAAFSRDGTFVVTASEDKTARVWDAATGRPLGPPLQHQGGVASAVFSTDGIHIVTASRDKTARIWNLRLDSRTLAEWRTVVARTTPYILTNGILLPDTRSAISSHYR